MIGDNLTQLNECSRPYGNKRRLQNKRLINVRNAHELVIFVRIKRMK